MSNRLRNGAKDFPDASLMLEASVAKVHIM